MFLVPTLVIPQLLLLLLGLTKHGNLTPLLSLNNRYKSLQPSSLPKSVLNTEHSPHSVVVFYLVDEITHTLIECAYTPQNGPNSTQYLLYWVYILITCWSSNGFLIIFVYAQKDLVVKSWNHRLLNIKLLGELLILSQQYGSYNW